MSNKNRDNGRIGEKEFSLLCSKAGVTCNKSIEDDFGWDMLVEFPPPPQGPIAIDMREAQALASVQIKATSKNDRTVSISLDNALRYARSPLPTFIVLVVIGPSETRFFAKHVWIQTIGTWLKAARTADAQGKTATHKQSVSIRFEETDEKVTDLLEWMKAQISEVKTPYAATKDEIVRTIGFGPSWGVGEATLKLQGPNDFLDLQLGLKSSIEATRFVYTTERFGIRAGKPEVDLENVQLSLVPKGRDGLLRVEFPTGNMIAVPATVFSATSANLHAWRVKATCLDLIFGPSGRVKARAHLKADHVTSLEELALFAGLQSVRQGAAVFLELEIDSQIIDLGTISMEGQDGARGWQWLALSIDVICAIGALASRRLPDISLGTINRSASELEILSALASERAMRLDFRPKKGIPQQFAGMLAYSVARVGDQYVGAVARRPISADNRIGKRRQITFGNAQLLYGLIGSKDAVERPLCEAYQRNLDRLSQEGDFLALGDLREVSADGPGDRELKSDLPRAQSGSAFRDND